MAAKISHTIDINIPLVSYIFDRQTVYGSNFYLRNVQLESINYFSSPTNKEKKVTNDPKKGKGKEQNLVSYQIES